MAQRNAGLQSLGLVAQPEEPEDIPWGVTEGERSTVAGSSMVYLCRNLGCGQRVQESKPRETS